MNNKDNMRWKKLKWIEEMAFAIDHPIRRRQGPPPNAVFPKYDVKIVAGRRIVIYHQVRIVVSLVEK